VKIIRNLGVMMDSSLNFLQHVNHVVSGGFYHLRLIKSSMKSLPFETAKALVNCFVINRIDYCNSLLADVPQYALHRSQRVMNMLRLGSFVVQENTVMCPVCTTAHSLQTVFDYVQSETRTGATILI